MLRKVEKILQRSQRGIRVKKGDVFLRNGRLLMITEVESGTLTFVESSEGVQKRMSLQEFRSRQIQRVKISEPSRRSAIDAAAEVMSSISLSIEAKLSALRSLSRKAPPEDRGKIKELIDVANKALGR